MQGKEYNCFQQCFLEREIQKSDDKQTANGDGRMTALPPDSIFKANDIRGVYGGDLTEDGARQIGGALAAAVLRAGGDRIAVGRDGRTSSPALADALAEGIAGGGAKALDIGRAPTPMLYYAACKRANGSGVMITGSHNPPAHNGMKTMIGGQTLPGGEIKKLLSLRKQNSAAAKAETINIMDDYIAEAAALAPACRPLHIVADAGNGVAGTVAPRLYRALGHRVTELFCEPDGAFPNHHPDPAQPENLCAAREMLRAEAADIAFVFDGDGDRLGAILPGEEDWVFPDRLLMLLARDMLGRNAKARVVFDVKCTAHLRPWIEKHGGIADMQPTGHAFIKARMRETGALLGGEMSGHFYFAENWPGFDDALLAGAKLAAIFAEDGNAMAAVPRSAASPEIVIDIGERSGRDIIADIKKRAQFDGAIRIVEIDGLRVEYADGFGLARASNTTSSLVLRFEGETGETLQKIKNQFQTALADVGLRM